LQERRPLFAALKARPVAEGSAGGRSRYGLILLVAVIIILVDQITKTLALDHLRILLDGAWVYQPRHLFGSVYLWLTFNSGFAFGLGAGVEPIIEAVVVVLVIGLVVFGRRAARASTGVDTVALGLLLGGALSNLGDRVFRDHGGAVIDFINVAQVGSHEYWPVFNVADAAIVVGAVTLAVQYSRSSGRRNGADQGRAVEPHEAP
jgi:signal peptidase II